MCICPCRTESTSHDLCVIAIHAYGSVFLQQAENVLLDLFDPTAFSLLFLLLEHGFVVKEQAIRWRRKDLTAPLCLGVADSLTEEPRTSCVPTEKHQVVGRLMMLPIAYRDRP